MNKVSLDVWGLYVSVENVSFIHVDPYKKEDEEGPFPEPHDQIAMSIVLDKDSFEVLVDGIYDNELIIETDTIHIETEANGRINTFSIVCEDNPSLLDPVKKWFNDRTKHIKELHEST